MTYNFPEKYKERALCLASASPRRRELLTEMGLSFSVMPADVDESIPEGMHPADAVVELSRRKALAVSSVVGDDIFVIASDTLVELAGLPLGKPVSEEDALSMLLSLAGREHRVHTGVAVAYHGRLWAERDTTRVFFRAFDEREARAYIAKGEPMDKAGAYGIQGGAALFATSLKGDYYNVMGLPVCRLAMILRQFGLRIMGDEA